MNNRKKNSIYSLILVVAVALVWFYRDSQKPETTKLSYTFISGEAQGTTYNITYLDKENRNFKAAIDSILGEFDLSLSTYVKNSEIVRFNQRDTFEFESRYFYPVLAKSKEIYEASDGAFDPTVYPLIEAWGFGPEKVDFPDSSRIDEIKEYVGFNFISFNDQRVLKERKKVSLDFNAIAQGYSIDVIFNFLQSKGVNDMMVELGGEIRATGKNENEDLWSIGIDDPKTEAGQQAKRVAIIKLQNEAISTSGNYRKFFIHEGRKYGHSINPLTGYPVQRDIISSTVIAPTCMEADAWSTTFMVVGLEKSKELLSVQNYLKAFFIYEDENGNLQQYYTKNLEDNIIL